MADVDVPQFLGLLVLILGAAKLFGTLAQRIGQPAVLGELVAGVIVGTSVLGLVDPKNPTFQLLAQVGVVLLLFEIGLETDLRKLLCVGGASTLVALVGVVFPFALGYAACRFLDLENRVAVFAGAALTATSVGITGRVLSDLGRLQEPESQIILGAAILDDIIGLVILTVVMGLTRGQEITVLGVTKTTAIGFGFLAATLVLGRLVVPAFFRLVSQHSRPGTLALVAVLLAFGLSWLAAEVGSAVIIGAFAAGLLLAATTQGHEIQRGVAPLGHFFVPLFFVAVGAAVDVRGLNPVDPANRPILLVGGMLLGAAILGKFVAGFAPFWFRGNKRIIGVGMIPRGEVGLIFAQLGLSSGVFGTRLFSAVTLMVLVTTFLTPPLLKMLLPPRQSDQKPPPSEGIQDLVTES